MQNRHPKSYLTGKENFTKATGKVSVRLTNDYMFKALLQRNHRVLKSLICSLLHLSPKGVKNVIILNPIILGETISDKEIILDINVSLNNGARINLEMQVVNEKNWPERSVYYACKNFTELNSGDDYKLVHPIRHIGIVDFTPLKNNPRFYATYLLTDNTSNQIYTDKFSVSTLDLGRIHLATEEDKSYNIDEWARLFKATTWEEIKMLATYNKSILDAAQTIYELSQDEDIRQICLAREKYNRGYGATIKERDQLKRKNARLSKELDQQATMIDQQANEISRLRAELAESKKRSSDS